MHFSWPTARSTGSPYPELAVAGLAGDVGDVQEKLVVAAGLHRADDLLHGRRDTGALGAQDVGFPEIPLRFLTGDPVVIDDVAVHPRRRVRHVSTRRIRLQAIGIEGAGIDVVGRRPQAPGAPAGHPTTRVVQGIDRPDQVGVLGTRHIRPGQGRHLNEAGRVEILGIRCLHEDGVVKRECRHERKRTPWKGVLFVSV